MKKDILEALEKIEKAYRLLNQDPNVLAPQFVGETKARLAIVIMNMTQVVDACVETEEINGGLN